MNKPDKVAQFLNRVPIDYPILWADVKGYKINGFPTLYIFDKSWKLIFQQIDIEEDLFEVLDKVLSELVE